MSDDEGSSQHEEVVTSLLDLQRRLRRHEDVTRNDAAPLEEQEPDADPLPASTTIVVQEADLQVLITPTAAQDETEAPPPGNQRLAGIQGRLEQVEQDLTVVRGSVEHLKADADAARAAEAAILDEVSAQREELRHAIDEGFRRLQETLTRLRSAGDEGTEETD